MAVKILVNTFTAKFEIKIAFQLFQPRKNQSEAGLTISTDQQV